MMVYTKVVRLSVDRSCSNAGEESPGSIRAGQLLTATKGNFRESATETIPLGRACSPRKGEKSEVRAHDMSW